ncbi:VapE domain-containing protein [Rhodococcus erythropolis]
MYNSDAELSDIDDLDAGDLPSVDDLEIERLSIRAELTTKEVGRGKDRIEIVAPTHANTRLVFERDPVLRHLGVNTMGGRLAWQALPPWRPAGREMGLPFVTDHDLAEIECALNWYFGGEHGSLSERAVRIARTSYAGGHRFSPWRDYLDALPEWDGVGRCSDLPMLRDADSPYVRTTLDNMWLGMMQRAYEPGCQVDTMTVLYGGQGLRKTSFFRAIPPPDMPVAELSRVPSDTDNKDSMAKAHAAPIVLIDELDKLRKKADQSDMKAFITGRMDTYRAPYARVDETFARQFTLMGTTNREEFLLDATGNRRYAVLVVESLITEDYLSRAWMDMCLAEARDRYRAGERLDYSAEYEALADVVREGHLDDPVREAVFEWLDDPRVPDDQDVSVLAMLKAAGEVPSPGASVDASRLSVRMVCRYIPELRDLNPTSQRDRPSIEKIEAALDAHPRYKRASGRPRVEGRLERRAWEMVTPAPPAPEPVRMSLDDLTHFQRRLLEFSSRVLDSPDVLDDPAKFNVGQLAAIWNQDGVWDEALAKTVAECPAFIAEREAVVAKVSSHDPADPFSPPAPTVPPAPTRTPEPVPTWPTDAELAAAPMPTADPYAPTQEV